MDASIFLENVDGSYTGIYCANISHDAIVGYDILTCLMQHYHTLDRAQQLIDCGHVEHVGKYLERSPVIQQYGYDYENNPLFQKLARTKQIQVINESLHHVEPMARQFERFYCKNHENCVADFENYNHGVRFIGKREKNGTITWNYIH